MHKLLPGRVTLGNLVSDKRASRKFCFVLCSYLRNVRSMCYTGLHSSSVCSASFLEEFFSETGLPHLGFRKAQLAGKGPGSYHEIRSYCF
jgi:hypothetical protein